MRREPPSLEQHARSPRRVALRRQDAAGDGGGGHQVRGQPVRLLCQLEGLVGCHVLSGLRLRGQQHCASAVGDGLVDCALPPPDRQGVERTRPVAGSALQVEQRLDRPVELRVEFQRALGELARCLLALALGLEEQAAQAELLGVWGGQHGLEDAPAGGPVAGKLRALRTQEVS